MIVEKGEGGRRDFLTGEKVMTVRVKDFERLESELSECKAQLYALKAELAAYKTSSDGLEAERDHYRVAVHDLSTALAAAQSECKEQARLNGMGSEREARLMARIAELEKELAGWGEHTKTMMSGEEIEQMILRNRELSEELERLRRHEFICIKCGLRKDGEGPKGEF